MLKFQRQSSTVVSMAITKQNGDVAEAYVIYFLKKSGFNVLIPWGEDSRYDLISEKNGIFKRIQVKYVTSKNGVLAVPIRSSNNYNIIHYKADDIDIIAGYCPNQNKVYFIPLEFIKNKSLCKLRLLPARNKQSKLITMASRYESRLDFLEK